MMKHGVILGAAAVLLSCSHGKSSGAPTLFYEDAQQGYRVENFDLFFKPYTLDASTGFHSRTATGSVHIDGLGDRQITVVDYQDALNDNGTPVDVLEVHDDEAGDVKVYAYDPAGNFMALAYDITTLYDSTSVLVGRVPGANPGDPVQYQLIPGTSLLSGKEMADSVSSTGVYADASPFGMVMAYANANAFLSWHCNRTSPEQKCEGDPGGVCVLFSALCDCALCNKLGRADCPLCK